MYPILPIQSLPIFYCLNRVLFSFMSIRRLAVVLWLYDAIRSHMPLSLQGVHCHFRYKQFTFVRHRHSPHIYIYHTYPRILFSLPYRSLIFVYSAADDIMRTQSFTVYLNNTSQKQYERPDLCKMGKSKKFMNISHTCCWRFLTIPALLCCSAQCVFSSHNIVIKLFIFSLNYYYAWELSYIKHMVCVVVAVPRACVNCVPRLRFCR